ncbi:hypothetical protein C0033_16030 [Clostridium sp. chh4-2]|uniref:hypothetical protein n=1 Tax=Clostridium sp. chh4-2 TaxID=2067550 RepID=UPI000CCF8396|nr:hypothetical protein [Clostridium sp. chh4-2]PNV60954.1 hypothetical protein C0033_16030 [Clostridium sp. chh4-2]
MNPMILLQFQGAWERFKNQHPKFPLFMKAVSNNALMENSVIEITVTTPEGKSFQSNLKLSADDLEMFEQLKQLLGK